ncbi:MAG: alpha/beta hydrolase [Microbacterium sp.]|uniref:alpha/beta hydrolase n=1 Tax=Microbacterium sp. TaxID=51671 RepID=UPI001AC409AC|nr:alpha/beta hydrolase [Microbacterium sp.]MBN9155786.1 alpha/beta hydrolase [Microbacterium sp.]MBN9175662.1 alpha/beta hydrolase [Microbacterium sp.]
MSAPDSGSPEIRTGWAGGRPPLDPELGAVLASLPPGSLAGVDLEGIAALRETLAARVVARERIEAFGVHIEDVGLTSFDGAQIALSTITPTGVRAAAPCLYFIHGGGMIAGTRMLRADALAETAVEFGLIVVTVEYRLAPEWPYPAAVEDCYAGLEWIVKHASPLGIDPEVLIVQGASAGGGLAAGVALMSRDRNGPRISNLILQAPMLDDRNTSTSSRELHADAPWDRQSNLTGWHALLGESSGGPLTPSYAAPARARDLSGMPPTFIDVGQVETFRDEAIEFAARLSGSGTPVEFHLWPGAWHGFDYTAPHAAVSQLANDARHAYLRRAITDASF